MRNELIPIKEKLIPDLKKILPSYEAGKNNASTGIVNAWAENICLDDRTGGLYVKADRLHTILRFHSKADGQYFVESIPKAEKITINGDIYVPTHTVIKKLNQRMIGADIKKRNYLKYSEEILIAIREAPTIRVEQERIRQLKQESMRKLKTERIKKLKIVRDELTNEPLIKKTAEFSHIRKKAEYYRYADYMQNGLIINKETHDIITKRDTHDEDELLALCREEHWNKEWYSLFKKWIKEQEMN